MNPCPCGFFNDPTRECKCSPMQIQRYVSKISGPLLDRIDIHIDVPAVKFKELASDTPAESSAEIRNRVVTARRVQLKRFIGERIFCNAQMSPRLIRAYCAIDSASKGLLENAITRLGLSARAYDRILKVSRTLADLEGKESIEPGIERHFRVHICVVESTGVHSYRKEHWGMILNRFGRKTMRRVGWTSSSVFAVLAIAGMFALPNSFFRHSTSEVASGLTARVARILGSGTSRVQGIADLPSPVRESRETIQIQFVSDMHGWLAVGEKLWRSEDGGKSWVIAYDALPDKIRKFQFTDRKNGWMISLTKLYRTEDGGLSWAASPQPIPPNSEGHLSTLKFLSDGRRGWIVGGVFTSTPHSNSDEDDYTPSRYLSPDQKQVLHGAIFYTEDGGKNWSRQLLTQGWGHLTVLFALDGEHAWAAGTAGGFYLSSGKWKAMDDRRIVTNSSPAVRGLDVQIGFPTIEPAAVFFQNPRFGWLSNSNGYLARSTDGGKTWQDIFPSEKIEGDAPDDFTYVFFADQLNGWALGYKHALYITKDGGVSWERQSSDLDFKAICFLDSGNGWAVAREGLFHLK